jgi:hypothetical protein
VYYFALLYCYSTHIGGIQRPTGDNKMRIQLTEMQNLQNGFVRVFAVIGGTEVWMKFDAAKLPVDSTFAPESKPFVALAKKCAKLFAA